MKKAIKIIGGIFTIWGLIMILRGDLTNGLLAIIVGELIDLPNRIISKIILKEE